MSIIDKVFRAGRPIPVAYRKNFHHLYMDILWFGLLNGTTLMFLSIYVTRLGGSSIQVGLVTALPALMNLIFALPTARWLGRRNLGRKVFWGALLGRIFYLPMVFLAWFLSPVVEVWVILTLIFIMNIPLTTIAVGFTPLLGEAVPSEWRGHVAGVRNGVFSIVTVVFTLAGGQVLTWIPFPGGYQIIFALGFIGAMMSAYHLWFIKPIEVKNQLEPILSKAKVPLIRFDVLKGSYGKITLLLFIFHLMQYLPIPLFPVYQVNELHFTDNIISAGLAIFFLFVFLGSTQLARLTDRLGNHLLVSIGAVMLSLYPGLMAFSVRVELLMLASLLGGVGWSMIGGALFNFLLEKAPEDDRPVYLAWYTVSFNAAVLIGSLLGPVVAEAIGYFAALLIFAVGRVLAGILIYRWGK